MYTAYFIEEQDIGDLDVLCALADEVGLEAAGFRRALESGAYSEVQKAAVAYARNDLAVRSVPTIFIGETQVEGGIYTKEGFEKLIDEAMMEQEAQVIIGSSCSIHGCN